MCYQKIIQLIKSHPDGCTISQRGLLYLPNHGYFIALSDNKIKKINQKTLQRLAKTAAGLSINQKAWLFGSWRDEKTGLYYIDLTIYSQSKAAAMALANVFGQKAIFDCKKLISIYL